MSQKMHKPLAILLAVISILVGLLPIVDKFGGLAGILCLYPLINLRVGRIPLAPNAPVVVTLPPPWFLELLTR